MPNRPRSGWTRDDAAQVVALDTKVQALDGDVKEIRTHLGQIERKFDSSIGIVVDKMDGQFATLQASIAEKGSTKWGVIWPALGVALSFAGMVGWQALDPLHSDIQYIKGNFVPRSEHERVWRNTENRFEGDETWIRRIDNEHRQEMRDDLARLERENYDLRKQGKQ